MKSVYPIDPSLQFFISDVLPFSNNRFAWLFKYMNAALRIYNWMSRSIDRDEIRITDVKIPRINGGKIPALLFRRKEIEQSSALLIYYHGGGFALSYAPLHIQLCKSYARDAGCAVLLPDYRLMPAYRWPHGFNDSFRTFEWAIQESSLLRIDPQHIIVGGDSAGGALAAGVAQKARDMNVSAVAQMLVYPILDSRGSTWSANEYKTTPLWNTQINENVWDMYLGSYSRTDPPQYAAPGLSRSLTGLPEAYIETAEFDPLHDEGVNYAQALAQAGVPVELHETQGTFHGFEVATKSPLIALSIDRRIAFLKNHI